MKTTQSLALLVAALAASGTVAMTPMPPGSKEPIEGTDRWRIRYADSLLSVNDICPVAKRALATKMRPVYVNGRPIGFC